MTPNSDQEVVTFAWNAVCIDCAPDDYEAMIALYRDMLGMAVSAHEERWASISSEGRMAVLIQVQDWYVPSVWPEVLPAQTKMMHFEVHVNDVPAAVTRAESFGARQATWQPPDRDPNLLRVMLDPAGHPFCLWR